MRKPFGLIFGPVDVEDKAQRLGKSETVECLVWLREMATSKEMRKSTAGGEKMAGTEDR